MATRVDPIEALRGASRSTARTGSLPRKTLVVFRPPFRLFCCRRRVCSPPRCSRLENQDFGFDQDRRIVANIDPRLAGYRADQLSPLYRRIHDSYREHSGRIVRGSLPILAARRQHWGAGVWVDGHPAPRAER